MSENPTKTKKRQNAKRLRRIGGLLVGALAITMLSAAPGNSVSVAPAAATSAVKTITVPLVASSWTTNRAASAPQASKTYLSVTNAADTTFLKFDLKALPANAKITASTLTLSTASTTSTAAGYVVRSASNSWQPATLVNAKKPAVASTQLQTKLHRATKGAASSIGLTGIKVPTDKKLTLAVNYSQKYVSTTVVKAGTKKPALKISYTVPTSIPVPPTTAPEKPVDSSKKVLAHYFPPYPLSLDNQVSTSDYYARNYLTINGESNKHSAYGGLLRDRPLHRKPLTGDYQLQDLQAEVGQATKGGIDGFAVDVLSFSGRNWDITKKLMTAAKNTNGKFVIAPNLDMTASAGKSSVSVVASKLAELYKMGGAYKLADGSYVLSSFKAEQQSPAWWTSLINTMQKTHGIKIKLISVLLNSSDANMKAYAPVSWALGDWGTRNAVGAANRSNRAAVAHKLGVKWMAGVGVQDVRPNQSVYSESNNTETFRTNWSRAISDGADMVQLVTWNDYSETTSIAPSGAHGTTFLDMSAYYSKWFKTRSEPKMAKDSVYLTHRNQRASTLPTGHTKVMKPTLDNSKTTPRDRVEVVTMLTAAADIKVSIGTAVHTYRAPAGVYAKNFPLGAGQISVVESRSGSNVISLKSPVKLIEKPVKQDLQYYGVVAHK